MYYIGKSMQSFAFVSIYVSKLLTMVFYLLNARIVICQVHEVEKDKHHSPHKHKEG